MYPEKNIPANPMGLSPQSSANMVGSMGDAVNSALPPAEPPPNPQEDELKKMMLEFQAAWKTYETMNGNYGGDAEKFRAMQKATEDWLASLELPDSSSAPTY